MQDIRNVPPETMERLWDKAGTRPTASDRMRALYNDLGAEQAEVLAEAAPVERPEMGEVKSVGGVDYEVTPKGWKKIGLTPAEQLR